MKLLGQRTAHWTAGNISDLLANPAYIELRERLEAALAGAEAAVEQPDPFNHGEAVGRRRAYRLALQLPEMLKSEAGGESMVKALR
ncbi:MAG: hypothetical protein ACREBG_06755 [Pyrinomonadaceae bacterium]